MKGVLFKSDMIKAIVEGKKTQTRRLGGLKRININPSYWSLFDIQVGMARLKNKWHNDLTTIKSRYQVGDVVYIKEAYTFSFAWEGTKTKDIPFSTRRYCKDSEIDIPLSKWHSPRFMPAWAARYFIQITDVKPQRLQEIAGEDCVAEGIELNHRIFGDGDSEYYEAIDEEFIRSYSQLWDSINPKYPWSSNPWVWVYTFKKVDKP